MFGWVFAAHMIGGGIAAITSGVLRSSQGDYVAAWLLAGALALLAAGASTLIPRSRAGISLFFHVRTKSLTCLIPASQSWRPDSVLLISQMAVHGLNRVYAIKVYSGMGLRSVERAGSAAG